MNYEFFFSILFILNTQAKPLCESDRFEINGICVQQFRFCPLQSIYLNDVCFPVSAGNCIQGQIAVNEECCDADCVLKCETTANCDCCGKISRNPTESLPTCAAAVIPPCGYPVLPCFNKPTSAPQVIDCPAGTKLVLGSCRLVHCDFGVYKDGHCLRVQCPRGTFWNGKACQNEIVNKIQVSFKQSYTTTINGSLPQIVLKYANSPTEPVQSWDVIEKDDLTHIDDILEVNATKVILDTSEPPATWEEILKEDEQDEKSCCDIISPRICQLNATTKEWLCFNRRHEYCGDFCVAKTVCLLPARSRLCGSFIVVTPPPKNVAINRNSTLETAAIDCSGCVAGDYNKCSEYCYDYSPCSELNPIDCQNFQQHEFCANNTGMTGCLEADGYYDSLPNFA